MKCGLLGEHLPHSYSPQIHGKLGDYSYALFEKTPEELADFLRFGDFDGLNVTIPYKKAVIPYCHALSDTARRLGAVNTIVRRPDGTLVGHNTDYFGFQTMVRESGLSVSGKKVLVLGSGGASNTAVAVMEDMLAVPVVISRTGENNYENLHKHADAAVIVNCTPVGMYPNTEESPLNIDTFPLLEGVLDVVYNPARTKLLQDAEQRGIIAMNGLLMLVAQAKESAEWFSGVSIDNAVISEIHKDAARAVIFAVDHVREVVIIIFTEQDRIIYACAFNVDPADNVRVDPGKGFKINLRPYRAAFGLFIGFGLCRCICGMLGFNFRFNFGCRGAFDRHILLELPIGIGAGFILGEDRYSLIAGNSHDGKKEDKCDQKRQPPLSAALFVLCHGDLLLDVFLIL